MTCRDVRDQLLDHTYGALEADAERRVQAHLDVCPDCRAELSTARHQSRVLADAARIAAPELSFEAPRKPRGRILTRGRLAAAAALVAAVTVGGIVHRAVERRSVSQGLPIVAVQGPRSFQTGAPAEFLVHSAGTVTAQVLRGGKPVGDVLAVDGERLRVNVPEARPGEIVQVRFTANAAHGKGSPEVFTLPLRDATRLVTRVGTDKPLYRPGDTVRVRAVALEGFRLTPAGDTDLRMQLLDPRGATVFDHQLPTLSGVTAWHHALPENAPGGAYRLVVSGPATGGSDIGTSERTFLVRSYRVPRLRFDVELDRDSYGAGGEGEAFLAVERVEGGVPAGAKVDAIVRVDGAEVSRETLTLPASGKLSVPFRLPAEIKEGRGQIALVVHDGGNVETSATTVPILLGRVDVDLFPEGGDLVAGLPGRVYFRARTPAGEPADVEAQILDGDGNVVASAGVDALGMGAFDLTPSAGASYRVVATKPAGLDVNVEFPAVRVRGVTLRTSDLVAASGGPLSLRVASTGAGRHQIVATCRGAQIAQESMELSPGDARDVRLLPVTRAGGVVRVTVFDPSGAPVAERLLSREPGRTLAIDVATEQPRYMPREHVKVNLVARDENGAPARAILGVSVVDEGVLSLANDEDTAPLAQHFLLGMEVEELENVELFADGPDAALAVDRLLGVQGWRRFAWRDATTFVAENPESGPRVVAVGNDESPQSWSNEGRVESRIRSHMRRVDKNLIGGAVALGFLAIVLGGLGIGVVSAVRKRTLPTVVGFGVSFLLIGAVVILPRMSADMAPKAMVAVAERAAGADMGPPEAEMVALNGPVEAKWEGRDDSEPGTPEELQRQKDQNEHLQREDKALEEAGGRAIAALDELVADMDDFEQDARFEGPRGEFAADSREPSDPPPPPGKPQLGDDARLGEMFMQNKKRWAKRNIYRYYAHAAGPATGARDDFAEVLYWHPLLITDEAGRASFEFDTGDSVTTFRISVEGHDGRGALTDATTTFKNRIPFYVEPKFPVELSAGDELHLPIVIANDTAGAFDVGLTLALSGDLLRATDGTDREVRVPADARGRALIQLMAAQGTGEVTLDLVARALGGLEDRTKRTIPVVPRGYPMRISESGVLEKVDGVTVRLPDDLNRFTLQGSMRMYPSTLSTLVDGLESMLRSPGGCFEQASSSNYPNVMVLNYLSEQDAVEPAVARRAKEMLDRGYKLLTGYECANKGYEWFGGDPGHEALTAYGLMEFVDMERVYDVDMEMVGRTRDWLMKRRDGKGGFERNARALDSFGGAPQEITDAYIVWAITEADGGTDGDIDLTKELALLEERATKSEDPYLIALAANALGNRELPAAKKLVDRLAALQGDDGKLAGTTTSITSSRGPNLDVETTALAALAFTRHPAKAANAQAAVRFLLESRQGGSFGATQATILALRALIEHAKASRKTASAHDLTVLVNGEVVAERHVAAGEAGVIVFGDEILNALRPGENDVEVKTTSDETLPWALALGYHTDRPPSDPDCPVGVTAKLDTQTVAEGETVGLEVVIENRTAEGLPMTLTRIGLPAGLEPRADQLEELRESGVVGFYETRPREVTIYFRDMAPNAKKRIDLDLVAAIPGRFEGPATSAYLYYGDDQKDWAAPLRIQIDAAK